MTQLLLSSVRRLVPGPLPHQAAEQQRAARLLVARCHPLPRTGGVSMTTDLHESAIPTGHAPQRALVRLLVALIAVGSLVAGVLVLRLVVNGWAPLGTGYGARLEAGQAPSEPEDVIDPESFVWHSRGTAHWAARGRWGITVPSGEVVAELRSTRIDDLDPSADYYAVLVETMWSRGPGTARLRSTVELTLTSDSAAIDDVFGATDSFISDADCTETVYPPTTGGAVPGGTAEVCGGYGVDLVDLGPSSAMWRALQPEGLRHLELVYSQKVPEGVAPTWTLTIKAPGATTTVTSPG